MIASVTSQLPILAVAFGMVGIAGLIRGFTGFGFSIAAVPLLSLVMPPAQAVPIVLLLQFLVSLSGLKEAVRICHWHSIRLLAIGAAAATPIGMWGLAHLAAAPVRLAIAAIVLIAVAVLARGVQLRGHPPQRAVFPVGILSGLFNGLAGMPGPPVIAFYLAAPVSIDVARASMIVFFLITAVVGLIPAAILRIVTETTIVAALVGLPAVWLGSRYGAVLYRTSSQASYRRVALALLVITALLAATRAIVDLMQS